MANSDLMELDGVVKKMIRGGKYEVEVKTDAGSTMIAVCHLGGKLRINKINIVVGDKVLIAVSPYDVTKGTIKWRYPK